MPASLLGRAFQPLLFYFNIYLQIRETPNSINGNPSIAPIPQSVAYCG
ncbi:MAG: hypothetical protein VKK42_18695 [Lyngbya sp.]|nr:hypothetical protein [Lyngbya sp.]